MQISFLDKTEKDRWLPKLFDLYYGNMHAIAPSGEPYEKERSEWLSEVAPAVDKAPRRVLLCTDGEALLGYMQYYTRNDLIMVEELQIRKDYQQTLLFFRLCRYLAKQLSPDILHIEAFAHKQNAKSLELMKKLGILPLDEKDCLFVHLRGSADIAKKRFLQDPMKDE